MGLYSENPAIVVKKKYKLTNTHVLYHNIFGVLLERAFKETQNFPSQCTTRMYISCPSVDVLINKPFKDEVRSLFEDHLDKNLDQYVDGKINAAQRRVLITKWVGEA